MSISAHSARRSPEAMISQDRLRVLARELGVRQGYVEKNYVNSWILWGIFIPAFEAKCDHEEFDVDISTGLPGNQREDIRRQWETTLPDLTNDPPLFDDERSIV